MTTNTIKFLAEQKRLTEAATKGPWQAVSARYGYDVSETWAVEPVGPSVHNVCHVTIGEADAAFIAAARTTAPRMIAALEAVMAVHRRDPMAPSWCCCEQIYPCSTVEVIEAELNGGEGE